MPRRGAETTIPSVLQRNAERPDDAALSWYRDGVFQTRYTYRNLREQVAAAAGNLTQRKIGPGDRVVILSNNGPEMFFLLLAVMSMGAIAAPVNPSESPRILKHVVATLNPSLIVTGSGIDAGVGMHANGCPSAAIQDLFATSVASAFDFNSVNVAAHDIAVILFTSGTTSEPKGVCLTHFNLLTNARGLYEMHRLAENPVHLCVLPLFHANAFGFSLVTSLFAGSHVVLCDSLPGYAVWSIISREQVNIISVVPQILLLLGARAPSHPPPPCLRYFVSAAAPLSREVAARFIATTGVRIHQGYGLSECVNFATTIPADIADTTYEEALFGERVPSIGTPLEGCDVFVRSLQSGTRAQPGEEGEIVVTGDTLMRGYWRNEPATRSAIVDDGLRTGDLGFYRVLNDRRFFFITGRLKEIIVRHGEKISPLAVEADLQTLHACGKFAVAGFENAAAGEEIGLYVQIKDPADRAAIEQAVRSCAPLYRPRLVLIGRQEIPATATGKVRREILGKRFSPYAGHLFGKEPILVEEPINRNP